MKRVLFSGYAPVHFLSFEPVYRALRDRPELSILLSGGFREKRADGSVTFHSDGFYDPFDVDPEHVCSVETAQQTDVDVAVCAHLSDSLFPRSTRQTLQIYHGVSFKNYAVRDKALAFDILCLPGRYHARKYREKGLIQSGGPEIFLTGFAKVDALVNGSLDRASLLESHGLDPSRPTLLYAPTGDKYNSLETVGEEVIRRLAASDAWNLVIKPHDHPKRTIDWFERLARYGSPRVRLLRDLDVVPWLHAADLLISDASSVITEYTLLDRPVVLLNVPKLLKRVLDRGGALDLDTYGHKVGPVVDDPSTIVHVVERQLADSSGFSERRLAMAEEVFFQPGSAAGRIAALVQYAATGDVAFTDGVERVEP